jgi:hypothetical protein
MIIDRRTFVQGTALVATAPILVNLLSVSSTARSPASLLPATFPPQSPASETDMSCLAFKIDGWDRCGDISIDSATKVSADAVTDDPAGGQVWISINQSWRTAWR